MLETVHLQRKQFTSDKHNKRNLDMHFRLMVVNIDTVILQKHT